MSKMISRMIRLWFYERSVAYHLKRSDAAENKRQQANINYQVHIDLARHNLRKMEEAMNDK